MGNCASFHKTTDMKVAVQIQSPVKDNTGKIEQHITGDGFLAQTSTMGHVASFRDLSSKEDLFFDSEPWLESDSEDYFSVNGDVTPSCGNTPIHHKSFIDSTQPEKTVYMDSASNCVSEPSLTDKKQLIELFRESFRDDDDAAADLQGQQQETKPTIVVDLLPSKPTSPCDQSVPNSVSSSGTPAYRGSRPRKDNSAQSALCCIPGLMRNLSFAERKKRLNSMDTYGL